MSSPYFDAVAAEWDCLRSGFFSEVVRKEALDALAVEAGSCAADVGAGSGFMTEALLERGLRVVAIDQSPKMLAVLCRKFAGRAIECLRGDAASLPLADDSVDHAVANMYLHHVESPAVAVREMARILRPGGSLAITDLEAHSYAFLRREHHDRWLGFSHQQVSKWLEQAGLEAVAIRPVGTTCNATSDAGDAQASIGIFLAVGHRPGRYRRHPGFPSPNRSALATERIEREQQWKEGAEDTQ